MEQQPKKLKFVAHSLIAINVIIFAVIFLIDPSLSTETLVKFGAKVNFRIVDGEYYRLITPMFLHWDLSHLGFNMFALHIWGRDLEIIFGRRKFLTIYFFAGLTGTVLSFLLNNAISAGASGAIFGLLGAHLYLFLRNKDVYKAIFGTDFLVIIAINVGYGFVNSHIDNWGHLGGMIGGALMCYIIGVRNENKAKKRTAILAIITVIALTGSITLRSNLYRTSPPYYYQKILLLDQSGDQLGVRSLLMEGLKTHPDDPQLNRWYQELFGPN